LDEGSDEGDCGDMDLSDADSARRAPPENKQRRLTGPAFSGEHSLSEVRHHPAMLNA
jgi:hypothetical protein